MNENNRSKEQLSDTIRATAQQLFNEHGIETVSMHQVAKCAGIGQGTLYRRYSNKGELCLDIMMDHLHGLMEQLEQYLKEDAHMPVQLRLQNTMKRFIAFVDQEFRWLGVMHAHIKMDGPKLDFYQTEPYLYFMNTISSLMREGMEKGSMRQIDPIYTAHSYISILAPHTFMHLRHTNGYSLEQLEELFCHTFIDPLFIG